MKIGQVVRVNKNILKLGSPDFHGHLGKLYVILEYNVEGGFYRLNTSSFNHAFIATELTPVDIIYHRIGRFYV